jgi:hypothetical protein
LIDLIHYDPAMADDEEPEFEVEAIEIDVVEVDDDELEDGDLDDEELEELDDEEFAEVPLSEALEGELAAFILIDEGDLAVSRAETLDFLIDTLRDLEDDDDIEGWVEQFGNRDFHLSQERDGRLVFSDVFPIAGVLGLIPKAIMSSVSTELIAQSEGDREGWLESLSDLIAEWFLLLTDEEKMVGHLIRAHELPVERTADEQAILVATHAALHAAG